MSGLLKDVMEERAAQVGAQGIDAAALVAAGRGRVRRRRAVTVVAATACAAVVATGLSGVLLRDERRDASFAPPAGDWKPASMTYSHGETIVEGDRQRDVGQRVRSFVTNAEGIVWTSGDGVVHFLPRDGSESQDIGRTDTTRYDVQAEPDGPLVAWAEWGDRKAPEFVVYDTAARTVVSRDRETEADYTGRGGIERAKVYAVDDGTVYRLDSRGAVALDVSTGEATVLDPRGTMSSVGDVAGGVVAWQRRLDNGFSVGPAYGKGVPTGRSSVPLLSPDGTYLSTEDGDEFHIQRTSDASVVTPKLPTYPFAAAYGWVDDDTVAVYAIANEIGGVDATYDLEFLTCSVSDGTCRKVGSDRVDLGTFSLPIGEDIASQ